MSASALARYEETARGCDIDLSDNTNLFGTPPSVAKVLATVNAGSVSRYPAAYSPDLKGAIAQYAGVSESMIVTGCGSDDVLDSAIRAFRQRERRLVLADPSFSMIPVFAASNGIDVVQVPLLGDDFAAAIQNTDACITYLCSPNNPTGTTLSLDLMERIVAASKGIVIIDEAYIEYGGTPATEIAAGNENVIVTRTLSKAFGLAGVRIGYGIGSPQIIARVEAARGPYKVSTLSASIAERVLLEDTDWVRQAVSETLVNRKRFTDSLEEIGYRPIESAANFILLPVADATDADRELRARGIAVRCFRNLTGIGDAARISIGPWHMMEACIDALAEMSQ